MFSNGSSKISQLLFLTLAMGSWRGAGILSTTNPPSITLAYAEYIRQDDVIQSFSLSPRPVFCIAFVILVYFFLSCFHLP